jgi:hypothetical protein
VRERPNLTASKRADRAGREERLAAALRANLRRRKEQARAQTASREALSGMPAARNKPVG